VVFALKWWVENHWHDFAVSATLRKELDEFLLLLLDSDNNKFVEENRKLEALIEQQVKKTPLMKQTKQRVL
jgi:hypothetical protein